MPGVDIFVTNAASLGLDQDLKRELLSYSSPMMPPVAEGHYGVFPPLISLVLDGVSPWSAQSMPGPPPHHSAHCDHDDDYWE
jgi:hypothetical protein